MGSTYKSLSKRGPPDFQLALPEEDEREVIPNCEQMKGPGIIVNLAFTPADNIPTAANKAIIKKTLYLFKGR